MMRFEIVERGNYPIELLGEDPDTIARQLN